MTEQRLKTSTQACQILDIKRSTLQQWIDKRWIMPFDQLASGAYLFTDQEIERAGRERAPAAEPAAS